ncbi:hypothetical protein FRIGORI9N_270085 [Frigoribacterium sp. 9N]|nr:hypothetical protein FRIGORI9N_270085 [Frigoribacterium sp. 9N]
MRGGRRRPESDTIHERPVQILGGTFVHVGVPARGRPPPHRARGGANMSDAACSAG